jgi:uncharacterized protein (DUF1501 family)
VLSRAHPFPQTRREFMALGVRSVGLVAASGYLPAFIARTAAALPADKDKRILVVIQLGGGNDGLNTVVPYADDLYYQARPSLGIRSGNLVRVDDHLGFNRAMTPLKALYDDANMAVVQGVGYPNPDRSHFRSMEIWHTADRDGVKGTGWLGRFFDHCCAGADPAKKGELASIGVSIGKTAPQAFHNRANVGVSVENPATFQWNPSGETSGLAKVQREIFSRVNRPGGARDTTLQELVRPMAAGGEIGPADPGAVEFLRHTAMNAMLAGDEIRRLLGKSGSGDRFSGSSLGRQMRMIASLIAGDFGARVYYANLGGFDTHSAQAGTHARLLQELSENVSLLHAELKRAKKSDQVLVMAFSEFGRRVQENGSGGTDHGAAAPVFLFGDRLGAGIHGKPPPLDDLDGGDLRHAIDFRSVYASILEDWLGAPPKALIAGNFEKVPGLIRG